MVAAKEVIVAAEPEPSGGATACPPGRLHAKSARMIIHEAKNNFLLCFIYFSLLECDDKDDKIIAYSAGNIKERGTYGGMKGSTQSLLVNRLKPPSSAAFHE
jgi:hypothetical protein